MPGKPACANQGSEALADRLEREIGQRRLPVTVERVYCLGQCTKGPNMRIAPTGRFFHHVSAGDIPAIIDELAGKKADPPLPGDGEPQRVEAGRD